MKVGLNCSFLTSASETNRVYIDLRGNPHEEAHDFRGRIDLLKVVPIVPWTDSDSPLIRKLCMSILRQFWLDNIIEKYTKDILEVRFPESLPVSAYSFPGHTALTCFSKCSGSFLGFSIEMSWLKPR
jgi:hypothetical protein